MPGAVLVRLASARRPGEPADEGKEADGPRARLLLVCGQRSIAIPVMSAFLAVVQVRLAHAR
jgi:hypothetical protein